MLTATTAAMRNLNDKGGRDGRREARRDREGEARRNGGTEGRK